MATREEWVRHFEDVNGRKPSPEEFMEARSLFEKNAQMM